MENNDYLRQQKLERAKKRVASLKGFYIHLAVYVLINTFILVNIYLQNRAPDDSFWAWEHFFTLIFWGIGLGFHAVRVFALKSLFGPEWEARQIKKIMERDEREARKYR